MSTTPSNVIRETVERQRAGRNLRAIHAVAAAVGTAHVIATPDGTYLTSHLDAGISDRLREALTGVEACDHCLATSTEPMERVFWEGRSTTACYDCSVALGVLS